MERKAQNAVPGVRTLEEKLLEALAESLKQVCATIRGRSDDILQPLERPLQVGIAFSGGRDSMALLEAAHRLTRSRRWGGLIEGLYALHVNHGISENADSWESTCRAFCDARRIPFSAYQVRVDRKGKGLEAAAREERYRALASAARELKLDVILTAHHQDDRLETFLLQWMRGAGVDGLSGMPAVREFGENGLLLARPWLDIPRAWIEAWAKARELAWVDDESNDDTAFLRNLIRHEVLPVLDKARPGFRKAASRSVELVTEAGTVLHSVAAEDVARCTDKTRPRALKIASLLNLSVPRQALCLRAWISSYGIEPPPRATLIEALRQAKQTHSDTALTIRLGAWDIRRWGADIVLHPYAKPVRDTSKTVSFDWNGEREVELAPWGGVLAFRPAEADEDGFPGELLRTGPLEVRARRGGEKIKLYRLRPSRNLKHLYQAAGIPSFERGDLPLLWCGEDLIYAAGLGPEVRKLEHPDGSGRTSPDRWVVSWEPDKPLFGI